MGKPCAKKAYTIYEAILLKFWTTSGMVSALPQEDNVEPHSGTCGYRRSHALSPSSFQPQGRHSIHHHCCRNHRLFSVIHSVNRNCAKGARFQYELVLCVPIESLKCSPNLWSKHCVPMNHKWFPSQHLQPPHASTQAPRSSTIP